MARLATSNPILLTPRTARRRLRKIEYRIIDRVLTITTDNASNNDTLSEGSPRDDEARPKKREYRPVVDTSLKHLRKRGIIYTLAKVCGLAIGVNASP
ncbi:uncharacterized protein N7496_008244 [Penicillium cataractarum]|uniref:Uncharacterized protein n=1 Tax=Penicillium cataractarum TaxID=2100454 RepID=A0A9W9V5J5_9EURO|nr:uncharacterized protein N7496_008244 [Penicillium cataractarum]KAJ5368484.1 hypothetical protein N7496_008244 [Penicillium cataractarum]